MDNVPKIKAFHNIDQLIKLLSRNGIEGFRPWRFDGYKWITFSDYKHLAGSSSDFTSKNNLAYYISSDDVKYAEEIKLVLNINNTQELQHAKDSFVRTALKTYSALGLLPPGTLLTSVNLEAEFEYEDDLHFSALRILRTKVFSWSLLIHSK